MREILEVGTKAPDFTLENSLGQAISLSDFKGKKIILYFYPKDNTPGCTTEACDFRDSHGEFEGANTVIIGISKDSVKSHSNFVTKYQLPFVLLRDKEVKVCEAYGIWQQRVIVYTLQSLLVENYTPYLKWIKKGPTNLQMKRLALCSRFMHGGWRLMWQNF